MKKRQNVLIGLVLLVLIIVGGIIYQKQQPKQQASFTFSVKENEGLEIVSTGVNPSSQPIPIIQIAKDTTPVTVKYRLDIQVKTDRYQLTLTNLDSKSKEKVNKHTLDQKFKYSAFVTSKAKNQLGYIILTNQKDELKEPQKATKGQVWLISKTITK